MVTQEIIFLKNQVSQTKNIKIKTHLMPHPETIGVTLAAPPFSETVFLVRSFKNENGISAYWVFRLLFH